MKKALSFAIVMISFVFTAATAVGITSQERGTTLTGCLPTCDETDGKFLAISAGDAYAPFTPQELSLRITVPPGTEPFDVGIFDGDDGDVDPSGDAHWDRGAGNFEFQVVTSGSSDGAEPEPATERFFSSEMPDNDWFLMSVPRLKAAKNDDGTFTFVLRITNLDPEEVLINSFKVGVQGEVSIPPEFQPFGIFTSLTGLPDAQIIYPSFPKLLPTTNDGDLVFHLTVPAAVTELVLWDGDLDFGSYDAGEMDTDDADTPAAPWIPAWSTSYVVPEGVAVGENGSTGSPADDRDPGGQGIYLLRSPSPVVTVSDPRGSSYSNTNPSGNEEWEQFRLTTDAADPTPFDFVAPRLPGGYYTVRASGIDFQNLTYWRFDHPVVCVDADGFACGCKGGKCGVPGEIFED